MDWHEYVTSRLVEDRVAEQRAAAERERLYRAYRPSRPPVRVTVGNALVRLGSRLMGAEAPTHLRTSYRRA